ncbi:MAG: hypothetical protein SPI58_03035 [Candidatus Enteromonas sp.]|nr:hypothetical protein [Candidatus Enteromonas sp.]MDY6094003.1 hypothetical protein [Candidatus Enteromonas sp.]
MELSPVLDGRWDHEQGNETNRQQSSCRLSFDLIQPMSIKTHGEAHPISQQETGLEDTIRKYKDLDYAGKAAHSKRRQWGLCVISIPITNPLGKNDSCDSNLSETQRKKEKTGDGFHLFRRFVTHAKPEAKSPSQAQNPLQEHSGCTNDEQNIHARSDSDDLVSSRRMAK